MESKILSDISTLEFLQKINLESVFLAIAAMLFTGLVSFALTPFARVLGFKIGAVDIPDNKRHFHRRPTPRCGGVAIFTAFFLGVLIFYRPLTMETIGLLLGTFCIMLLGLWDDTVQLKPLVKLLGQLFCAGIPIVCGITIDSFTIFGHQITLSPVVSVLVTLFWIVFLTNAVNLIDGLDGLACGVSAVSSVSLLICSLICAQLTGERSMPMIVAILASACIGFLPSNMSPAKIFMGDSGALSLGFVLSTLSVIGLFKIDAVYSFFIPFIIFALPLFDTAHSFIRRILHRQSPFAADRKHIHHRLLDFGFKQQEVVIFLLSFSSILGISAILFSLGKYVSALIIAATAIILLGLMFIIFRHKKVGEFLQIQREESVEDSKEESVKEEKKQED
ncbi:MAG: undecaprenyl/decaprenyl-phosphate alpha-N-acetylglucosaminyl 1-phosphate transferase [Clostridia bacterium]|nr:undecaprenyl/decaprenyl-phosphate alpha-N-acetylglucosaminyl 1-phosphate transferase [Clostridia bacterium]